MSTYDAIVVGARCAGSPTAMLLARQGHRVLLMDRMSFPSDTLSTHVVQPRGVAALHRWGLLSQVVATGCPPVERFSIDFGPLGLLGSPRPTDGIRIAYAPRRILLDKILLDAAAQAGAEVRERFTVDDLVVEDGTVVGVRGRGAGGRTVVERARVVVAADGVHSAIARRLSPESYDALPPLQVGYYTYWADLPVDAFEVHVRPGRGMGAVATNDGLTMLVVGWPQHEAHAFRADIEANYLRTLDLVPELAERVRSATRVERFAGGSVPNGFRRPHGPGWALVGDAGYSKDPITAQGITDAFHDAERVAGALHDVFVGTRTFEAALAAAHAARDAHARPIYGFTTQLATLAPPPPEMQALLGAIAGDQEAVDDFVSVNMGTLSPEAFFDPANIGALMARAS